MVNMSRFLCAAAHAQSYFIDRSTLEPAHFKKKIPQLRKYPSVDCLGTLVKINDTAYFIWSVIQSQSPIGCIYMYVHIYVHTHTQTCTHIHTQYIW